ncbi:hypothetical protein V8C42DRAFT_360845 [Trichoderma barbatum]
MQSASLPLHHRGGFAAFLHLVKSRVIVDWSKLMDKMLQRIENDTRLIMGKNFIQESYLHLHLLNVFSVDTLRKTYNSNVSSEANNNVLDWADMPSTLSVTLRVPRKMLAVFTEEDSAKIGTVPVQCSIQHSPKSKLKSWQSTFVALQMGFGDLSASGPTYNDACKVCVTEDL